MSTCVGSFDDIANDFDRLFDNIENLTRCEALSLDAILRAYGAQVILDCACGTGIQSIGLAQKGYDVFASDISKRMIAILLSKIDKRRLHITTKTADFRTLKSWPMPFFDAVVCGGNSLTLLSNILEVKLALTNMRRVLKGPGGIVIIGLHNYPMLRQKDKRFFLRRAEIKDKYVEVVMDTRLFRRQRVEVTHIFIRRKERKWSVSTYTKSYICMSAKELYNIMYEIGYKRIELLDMTGTKQFDDAEDEWLLAIGNV